MKEEKNSFVILNLLRLITKVDTAVELKNKVDQLAHLSDHFNIFLGEGLLNNLNKSDAFEILFKVNSKYYSFMKQELDSG